MRALLSFARTNTKPMFMQDLNQIKRLEFAHQTNARYIKHSKVATSVMFNENTRCFTSFNEKELCVWNPLTSETLFKFCFADVEDLQNISCLCYSRKYHLYFTFTQSCKLCVLNEYLNLVAIIPLKIRLVQKCFFVDSTQQLITAGVDGCFLI